ncbi:MAG: arginine deiminase family protein [Novosphingobium sp.]|uniref:dimethylarginine dimethylaminohydrolase family protein n=1 Tax=Novosphingobium sp. TaxID=1874826 RepID=UPI00301AC1E4
MRWTVDSETGVLTDVLLCPPDHYRWIDTNSIAHSTLTNQVQFDADVAKAQYAGMVDALERAGVTCHFLTPDPEHPYQVYTRDSSQTTPWGPVLTQLRMPARRGEYAAVLDFHLKQDGFWRYATSGTCEGGDIHLIRPGLAVIGYSGVRTDLAGARQMAGWFEAEGWEVRLQPFPEHFLHLDVLFCMATDNLAVACIEALGEDFADWLTAHGIDRIEASYAEVMAMSCNLLSLGGNRVLSPAHSTRINDELRRRQVQVFDPPLEMFSLGGGSIHCLTMPLRREPLP